MNTDSNKTHDFRTGLEIYRQNKKIVILLDLMLSNSQNVPYQIYGIIKEEIYPASEPSKIKFQAIQIDFNTVKSLVDSIQKYNYKNININSPFRCQ